MTPFARIRREAKNAARQAAEIAAVADLPMITMTGVAIVRPVDKKPPVVSQADDDDGYYPKIFGAPEAVNFQFPE